MAHGHAAACAMDIARQAPCAIADCGLEMPRARAPLSQNSRYAQLTIGEGERFLGPNCLYLSARLKSFYWRLGRPQNSTPRGPHNTRPERTAAPTLDETLWGDGHRQGENLAGRPAAAHKLRSTRVGSTPRRRASKRKGPSLRSPSAPSGLQASTPHRRRPTGRIRGSSCCWHPRAHPCAAAPCPRPPCPTGSRGCSRRPSAR